MRALACVSLVERKTMRDVLCTTLIKDLHDVPLFEDLFDWYFAPPRADTTANDDEPQARQPGAAMPDLTQVVLDTEDNGLSLGDDTCRTDAATRIQPGSLDEIARALMFERALAILDQVMQRASHQVTVRRAGNAARPGELAPFEAGPTLDADLMLDALGELLANGPEDEGAEEQGPAEDTDAVLDELPDALKQAVLRRLADRTGARHAVDAHRDVPSQRFSEDEQREMAEIVRRLGRQMQGARSYRRVVARRGRIHVARTLRASMSYDGIPFRPVVTITRNEKPRIVVICDVSLSVRNTARFMLHLVYSLQALFDRVRSFVFVEDLAEASHLFERLGIDEAIAAILDGTLIDCEANSNYGRALETFVQQHLGAVTGETTVIVLGDGRGNRNPPNVQALEEIGRRCRQLVWLSPEPRGSWGLGSSDMPLYEPVCHRAEVVRNLKQLGMVAEDLIRRPAAGGRS